MSTTTWHEDDALWELHAPWMFTAQRWAGTPREVDQLLALLDLAPGTPVLDLCCGPGRHSLELARRGFAVTGVDRTAGYLTEARQRAEADGLAAEFVAGDMREFCRPGAFGAALNMFTAFGYFEDPAENQRVLDNLHRSLRTGGKLLLELAGKEILARVFRERDWHEKDGVILLEERQLARNWSWVDNRWIILDGTRRVEKRIGHWLYSAAELEGMLHRAGFGEVRVYGVLDGIPYDQHARRLVVVATA